MFCEQTHNKKSVLETVREFPDVLYHTGAMVVCGGPPTKTKHFSNRNRKGFCLRPALYVMCHETTSIVNRRCINKNCNVLQFFSCCKIRQKKSCRDLTGGMSDTRSDTKTQRSLLHHSNIPVSHHYLMFEYFKM